MDNFPDSCKDFLFPNHGSSSAPEFPPAVHLMTLVHLHLIFSSLSCPSQPGPPRGEPWTSALPHKFFFFMCSHQVPYINHQTSMNSPVKRTFCNPLEPWSCVYSPKGMYTHACSCAHAHVHMHSLSSFWAVIWAWI